MQQAVKTIAVVQGESGAVIQEMFRAFVARWRQSARIVGLLEETVANGDRACSAGTLQSIATGTGFPMFQDLGPGSTACCIDPVGVALAGEAVRQEIGAGCDLVLLNRFGKLEAGREGLMPAFAAAVEAEVPLLTSVAPAYREAWERFAAPLHVTLPPEADALEEWWRSVSAAAPAPLRSGLAASHSL